MSCNHDNVTPDLFTVPPYVNVTNPPPETLGNPGDILIRGDGPVGTADYFAWIPADNITRFSGQVGAEVNAGQALRYDELGRLVPYALAPFPVDPPPCVGIAINSATSGEIMGVREGVHEGGWSFAPGARLWVGPDSYPTPVLPTWGTTLECGFAIKPGFIRFDAEPPISTEGA